MTFRQRPSDVQGRDETNEASRGDEEMTGAKLSRHRLRRKAEHVSSEPHPMHLRCGEPGSVRCARLAPLAGLALIIAELLGACTAFSEHPCPTTIDTVRDHVAQLVDAGEIPSMSIAVSWHGEIYWEEAFGWADQEKRVPATVDTRYALASVSKPLTATAFMILVDRGFVSLEDPVNAYPVSYTHLTLPTN